MELHLSAMAWVEKASVAKGPVDQVLVAVLADDVDVTV